QREDDKMIVKKKRAHFKSAANAFAALMFFVSMLAFVGNGLADEMAYKQAPMLDSLVPGGPLPPVKDRLPEHPLVVTPLDSVGHYGGTARAMHSSTSEFGD